MQINTQICGLIIAIMLIFFYNRQPTMGLNSEKQFKRTLFAITLCILIDILDCFAISHSYLFSKSLVIFITKLYLLSIQTVAFSALSYTISGIVLTYGNRRHKFLGIIIQTIYIMCLLITMFLSLDTYYDGISLYAFGPAVYATYFISACYLLTVIIATFTLKKYIKPKKRHALWLWMGIWATAATIEFFNPKYLIVGFASCVGAMICYFLMENPDASISRRTGHFSSSVLIEYFDYLYQGRQKFSVMMISFMTVADSASDTRLLRQSIEKLSEFLFSIKNCKVFDTTEGYFILVFDSADFMESTKFKINTYFQSIEDNPDVANAVTLLSPYYTIVPNCNISGNGDELLNVLTGFIPNDHKAIVSNEVTINAEVMTDVKKRKQVENMVISAMENDQIEVFYQPIYDIAKDKFTTAEALVRIRLRDGKLVLPGDFIPIVEETGRIIPLSDAIYRKTLTFLKSYRIDRLGIEQIELNLSLKQAESSSFATKFEDLISKTDIDPALINLEITETSKLSNFEMLMNNMNKLAELGSSFSIDDFGTGTSNLNYIIDMPINIIKLDRHLISSYFINEKAQAVINAIISMAHSVNIKIIAEGIESADEVEAMKKLGVDYIQGYFYSKALPEHEFLKFLQNHNL